jgi:hypothetical protein
VQQKDKQRHFALALALISSTIKEPGDEHEASAYAQPLLPKVDSLKHIYKSQHTRKEDVIFQASWCLVQPLTMPWKEYLLFTCTTMPVT